MEAHLENGLNYHLETTQVTSQMINDFERSSFSFILYFILIQICLIYKISFADENEINLYWSDFTHRRRRRIVNSEYVSQQSLMS